MSYSPEQIKLDASIVKEAAEVLQMVADSGVKLPPNWRWPLLDELSGIAYAMQDAATLRQAARVDEVKLPDPETMCAMWIKPRTSADEYAAFLQGARKMRAALEAALSAQPAEPAAQAEADELIDAYDHAVRNERDSGFLPLLAQQAASACVAHNRNRLRNAIAAQPRASEPAERGETKPVAWMCETVNGYTAFSRDGKFPCNAGKVTALYLHPAAPVGVPDGMVLVPREPTPEMKQRGAYVVSGVTQEGAAATWAAMLAAAPSAPEDAQKERE